VRVDIDQSQYPILEMFPVLSPHFRANKDWENKA